MKKLLLCMFLAFGVAAPVAVADTGSAVVLVDAGSESAAAPTDSGSGSAVATPPATGSDAASQLHDPTKDLSGTISDLEAAKKTGWGFALFAALVILCRFILPLVSSRLAFLREGKAATIAGAIGAAGIAGYDALVAGASWYALLGVLIGAVLHYIDATPPPAKPAT
jgi:hypothetical protein